MGKTPLSPEADTDAGVSARGRRAAKREAAATPGNPASDLRRCQRDYAIELARYSSHISSALGEQSTETEIDAAVQRFTALHGDGDLLPFLSVLAQRVQARGHDLGRAIIEQKLAAAYAARAIEAE